MMQRLRQHLAKVIVGALALGVWIGIWGTAQASALQQAVTLYPGTSLTVSCSTLLSVRVAADKKSLTVACAAASSPTPKPSATKTRTPTNVAPTATALAPTATRTRRPTRTSTVVPPTPTASPTAHVHATNTPVAGATQTPVANQLCPESVHDQHNWHAPVHSSGCYYGHEHGDAPPQWVVSSRWPPMFTHPGNTPNENVLKHSSFKGFTLSDDGISVYVIMHLDTNPNGHSSRFHSYQVWARDASGGISYWDLWADFGEGNNTGPNLRYDEACGGNTSVRPIMAVNFANCPLSFESWYSRAGAPGWGWDLGFNVKPQYYSGASPSQPSDPDLSMIHTWLPTGEMNDTRRIELAWYAFRQHPTGTFYSTQFGEIVSGPTDPVCGSTRTFGTKSYTVLCLEQYVAPTMTTFDFPGNSVQKDYDFTGVRLPN